MKKIKINYIIIFTICIIFIFCISNQILAQNVRYVKDSSNTNYPFIWSDPDSTYLTKLRTKYKLDEKVADCENDYDKAKVIVSWVTDLWEHHGSNKPQNNDPISIIEAVKEGKKFRCVEYGIVVSGALNALGIPSRVVGLSNKHAETELLGGGHVVADAYIKDLDKWIMIDGQWGVIPTLNGTPLNAVELQQALAKQKQPTNLGVYSNTNVDVDYFFNWIEKYLFYIDVPFDNRVGMEKSEYASGNLMLVPQGAIRPEKFQIRWKIGDMIYTHSINDLYPKLSSNIYKDVELKKIKIKNLFKKRSVNYQSENIIEEIIIEGLNRTKEDVVKRQLPYKTGDKWTKELKELTKQRLAQLAIFNPITIKVRAEKIKEKKVRVIISTEDINPNMIHPVKILYFNYPTKAVVFKSKDLYDKQLTHRIINPFGNGLSISAGVNWSSNSWWEIGLDYIGSKGKVYSLEYNNFKRNDEYFNNIDYKTDGYRTKFSFNYIPKVDWKFNYSINYQKNDYIVDLNNKKQEYLIVGTEVEWTKYDDLNIKFDYGKSLIKEESDFKKIELSWDKLVKVKNDKLFYNLSGGISSKKTPFNYIFKAGRDSEIPLTGHDYDIAGNKYLSGNIEYHKLLIDNWIIGFIDLWGITFVDYAKIIPGDRSFSDHPWEVDGGIGLAFDTSFGIMRLDVGLDNLKNKPKFSINFEYNF